MIRDTSARRSSYPVRISVRRAIELAVVAPGLSRQLSAHWIYHPAMTTPDAHTVISVRGESQRMVAPDQASIYVTLLARGDTKRAAYSDLTRALDVVTAELAELGGEGLTALTTRAPLTSSIQSIHTNEEGTFDQATGAKRPTGRHQASANLLINVRDFELLGRVEGIVTGHDVVNIGSVHWYVDEDNPARPQVRADAIRSALQKGQDYASALGGSIVSIEHIADAGLLGDNWHDMANRASGDAPLAYRGAHTTSLYPVPQAVGATIEARLTATIRPLPTN